MFFKSRSLFAEFILASFALLVIGCAEPKYLNAPETSRAGTSTQRVDLTCETKLASSGLCVSFVWEAPATASAAGTVVYKTFRLNAFDQSPVLEDPPQELSFVLWMRDMGHGSAPTQTTKLDTGTFRVTNIFFVMPGDWEFQFRIKETKEIDAYIPIRI